MSTASHRPPSTSNAASLAEPARKSTWGLRANVGRMAWGLVAALLWRRTPRGWSGFRCFVLRRFGATVGTDVAIDPDVRIEIPWHLSIGDRTRICRGTILYCLGRVTIGSDCLIGPYVHVCAGTHDYTDPSFMLVRSPITIERGCVVLAAAFIAPGVTVAPDCVVRERAGVVGDTEPGLVYDGHPAKAVEPRAATEDAP